MIDVVAGILIKDQKLLIARRLPKRKYGDKWEFPGGKVEEGELHIEALRRELLEEIGIDAMTIIPLLDCSFPFDENITLHFFVVPEFYGVPALKDHSALAWETAHDIWHNKNLINVRMLDAILKLQQSGWVVQQ